MEKCYVIMSGYEFDDCWYPISVYKTKEGAEHWIKVQQEIQLEFDEYDRSHYYVMEKPYSDN